VTTRPIRRPRLSSIGLLLALGACGARSAAGDPSLDAGPTGAIGPVDATAPELPDAPVDAEAPEEAAPPPETQPPSDCSAPTIEGTWQGTIDGFRSASGSDKVTMTFAVASDGSFMGTVYFGDATPPPPPTDPDVGYPTSAFSSSATTNTAQLYVDGFRHTAHSIIFDGVRLRLQIPTLDVWAAWCALQTTTYFVSEIDGGPALYECLPNWGIQSDGNGDCDQLTPMTSVPVPVNCGKAALCAGFYFGGTACRCSATSCTANTDADPGIAFDMQLACDQLDGSSAGQLESLGVHLTRSP
jgi:hypothetical protein